MNERTKIEERLRKKEQEVGALEDKLRSSRVYVQALKDILKMLGEDIIEAYDTESILRTGSAVDKARRVILDRKEPVHIDEILEALGRDVTRESKASLTSSLAAYVRRRDIFTRPAPNTFGLAELGHVAIEDVEREPPASFGKITAPDVDDDIPF